MKIHRTGSAAPLRGMARFRAAHHIPTNPAPRRLQQALAVTEELRQALETSQSESKAVRRKISLLVDTNARLRELALQRARDVAKVRYLAHHDELTGLPNRILLLDRLDQALARAKRQHKHLALLFLDLDRFKDINDSYGHAVGDEVLRQVAARLSGCLREVDTIARQGGDEFLVLLDGIEQAEQVTQVTARMQEDLARPMIVEGREIAVTSSIGIALYPKDGKEVSTLIRMADLAMYRSKQLGRNTVQFYTPELDSTSMA